MAIGEMIPVKFCVRWQGEGKSYAGGEDHIPGLSHSLRNRYREFQVQDALASFDYAPLMKLLKSGFPRSGTDTTNVI
jgi:hypothetical protein